MHHRLYCCGLLSPRLLPLSSSGSSTWPYLSVLPVLFHTELIFFLEDRRETGKTGQGYKQKREGSEFLLNPSNKQRLFLLHVPSSPLLHGVPHGCVNTVNSCPRGSVTRRVGTYFILGTWMFVLKFSLISF